MDEAVADAVRSARSGTSSDTRSDTRAWRRFIAIILGVTAIVILSAFVFVAVVDPYDNLAFSPSWKRYRVTTNER